MAPRFSGLSTFSSRCMLTTKYLCGAMASRTRTLRRLDPRPVVVEHLAHRRAGEIDAAVGQALRQQVAAGMLGIDEVEIGDVIDQSPVDLLRYVEVETAVASFHVIDGNLQPLGHDCRNRAVGVAEDQHRIGAFAAQDRFDGGQNAAKHRAERGRVDAEEMIGAPHAEIREEDLVELVVVVLAGVDQHMMHMALERRHHSRQADDLRPRAQDGHHLEFVHELLTGSKTVSGLSLSKISCAQN